MKLSNKITGKKYSSYARVTQISLILFVLSGCGGGNKNSDSTVQNQALSEFKQREAIVLAAIHKGEPVVIPTSLKTVRELQIENEGAYGSLIGKPAIYSMKGAYLSSEPCVLLNDPFAATTFSAPDKDTLSIDKRSADSTAEQSLAIQAALSGGYGMFSASASTDIQSSSLFSKSSIGFVINSAISGKHFKPNMNTANLPSFFKSQYLTWGNLNANYYGLCGDSFVSEERYSAGVKATLNIELQSEDSASSFGAALGASYGKLAEFTASIKNAESSKKASGTVTLEVEQQGGISGELNKIIPHGIITCSLENFKDCEDALNIALDYSKTIGEQVTDPTTKNLIPSRLGYNTPSVTPYTDMVRLSSDAAGDANGVRAVNQLTDIYRTTLILYYGLHNNLNDLDSGPQGQFDSLVLKKLVAREKYIVSMSSKCYENPSECAKTYLPEIINTLNSAPDLSINVDDLRFYSKIYTADNFMNLNGKFGSDVASKHINTILVPNTRYTNEKTGITSYSYVNKAIEGCDSTLCQAGKITVVVKPVTEEDGKVNYPMTIDDFTALKYDCLEVSATNVLKCNGYNVVSTTGTKGNYKWFDSMKYSYVAGLTDEKLTDYASIKPL
jgi:hypothetical protein